MAFDQTLPPLLAELHTIELDHADGDGIDFEPYQEFQSADDNAAWIRAWTGNPELTGAEYRVFGQDGTGGYAAFWRSGVSRWHRTSLRCGAADVRQLA